MLLTLLIWAWLCGVRSSRRIERAGADVVSYRVICAGDGPDHVTIARFRADNHGACRQLFTQVLMLAAQLGLGRLETVALDGVKIASNASLQANRTRSGLARAAEGEAARIAEAAVNAHAATDAAEDAVFGPDNPGLVPAELADPCSRAARIDEAKTQLDADTATDSDDPDDPDDPPAHPPEATGSVEPESVPRNRAARIAQAQAHIDAEITAERAEREATVQGYLERIAAGEKLTGRVPAEVAVAVAEQQLAETIAAYEAKSARRAADAAPGRRGRGRLPVPVEQYCRVQRQRARLEQARAAEATRAADEAAPVERTANITDPQSRMQPLRGGGWLQGYNCQAATAADGLIVATRVGTSPVDNQYHSEMVDKAVAAAELISKSRDLHAAATEHPAQ